MFYLNIFLVVASAVTALAIAIVVKACGGSDVASIAAAAGHALICVLWHYSGHASAGLGE